MILSISQLKARFLKGMKPTAEDFANLIDSFVHKQGTQAKVVFATETVVASVESNEINSLGTYSSTQVTISLPFHFGPNHVRTLRASPPA